MRAVSSAGTVLFVLAALSVVRADEPFYDASIEGTVDMIDHARGTISIVPLRPVGETFRVSRDCQVTLSRKPAEFSSLEPGHKVALTYDRSTSQVGRIFAIPGNQLRILRPKDKQPGDEASVARLRVKPTRDAENQEPTSVSAARGGSRPASVRSAP
jgi:hypothetical protein